MTHCAVQTGGRVVFGALIIVSVFFKQSSQVQAQASSKGFRVAEPHEPPYQNQIKYVLTGAEGLQLKDGKVLLKQVKMETFTKTGERESIASAPECIVDTIKKALNSAGPVQMQTADGKFLLQGEGFLLRQTNLSMVISNKVQTTLHNDLLAAQTLRTGFDTNNTKTNWAAVPTVATANKNTVLATNQITKVFSERADFSSVSNIAVYSGDVRVADSRMDMTCETMTLRRATNGSLESIVAETNVVIISKQDNSRATGAKAVYIVNVDQETVELTGNAHWRDQDSQREVKADAFVFDRRGNNVRAEPNAYLRLPRTALGQSGPLSPKPEAPGRITHTNEFIEITSQALTMQLLTTNGPNRVMIAQTNVVILSPADNSRATGDEAVYKEADSTFSLSGNAIWSSDQRLVRGDTLTFDRTNQIFTARSNAFLKLPVAAFGKLNLLPSGDTNSSASAAGTNQFIEVFADECDYRNELLTFQGNVRGSFLEGEAMRGWMTCAQATVEFTNKQVKQIIARQKEAIGQVPAIDETTRKIYNKLNCEILTVNISTNGQGQVESFVAEQDVVAEQVEVRPGTNDIHTKLTSEIVTGYVFAHTNQIQRMVAERNVSIEQGNRSAQGDKAVYTATNKVVELTGNPKAQLPEGRISKAEALIWDRANEKLAARGSKSIWHRAPGGTNQTILRFPK